MTIVLVSRSASFNLDNSMFVVEGSWETGYVYNKDVFSLVKVDEYCIVDSFSSSCLIAPEDTEDAYCQRQEQVCLELNLLF